MSQQSDQSGADPLQQAYEKAGVASVQTIPKERDGGLPSDLKAGLVDARYGKDMAFTADVDRRCQQADGVGAQSSHTSPPHEFTGNVPSDVEGYRIVSEKLTPFMPTLEGDDLFKDAKAVAQRAGLTDRQFNEFVGPMLERMSADGDMPGAGGESIDFRAEALKLVPPEAMHLDEPAKLAAAHKRIDAALGFVTSAEKQGLDPKVSEFLIGQLGDDPRGIQAIEWFQSRAGAVRPGGQQQQQFERPSDVRTALTDGQLAARCNDPRYDPRSIKFDREFAAETDRLFKARYG